jgi:cytohesin
MKSVFTFCALVLTASLLWSQEPSKTQLEKGLFEEQVQQNLPAAVEHYQSFLTQQETLRRNMAMAVWRLGEVYLKQGKTNEAHGQFRKLLQLYPDQTNLVAQASARLPTEERINKASGASAVSGGQPAFPDEPPMTAEEEQELRKVQAIAASSPDLLFAENPSEMPRSHVAAGKGHLRVLHFLLTKRPDVLHRHGGQTLLHTAAEKGHKRVCEFLLESGANANIADDAGTLPLHLAASRGFDEVARVLIPHTTNLNAITTAGAFQPEWDTRTSGPFGTPLHGAVRAKSYATAWALLEAGADPNISLRGITPLHEAVQAQARKTSLLELLLKKGARPNGPSAGKDDLSWRVMLRSRFTIQSASANLRGAQSSPWMVPTAPELRETTTPHFPELVSFTPLHLAAATNPEALIALLKAGANPNAEEKRYRLTPLLLALHHSRHTNNVKALLQHGADPNRHADLSIFPPALSVAARDWGTDVVEALLAAKANPNQGSPLPLLVGANRPDILQLLLKAGADPNLPGSGRAQRPLHLATNLASIDLLLNSGADPNARDIHGETPLLSAIIIRPTASDHMRMGDPAIIRLLLQKGADPCMPSFGADTPLSRAERFPELLRLLMEGVVSPFCAPTNAVLHVPAKGSAVPHGQPQPRVAFHQLNGGFQPTLAEFQEASSLRLGAHLILHRTFPDGQRRQVEITNTFNCKDSPLLQWGDVIQSKGGTHHLSPLEAIRYGESCAGNAVFVRDNSTNRWELAISSAPSSSKSFWLKRRLFQDGITNGAVMITRPAGRGLPSQQTRLRVEDPASDVWLRDGDEVRLLEE